MQQLQQLDRLKVHRWVHQVVETFENKRAAVQPFSEWRTLPGGTSSCVLSIKAAFRDGDEPLTNSNLGAMTRTYVLRLVNNKEWLQEEPDLALHEAASLQFACAAGIAAPELVGFDADGSACGMPAVLMTKLPGRNLLKPEEPVAWLEGMAESLANIHKIEASDFAWSFAPYMDLSTFDVPAWSAHRAAWAEAIALASGPAPEYKPCFIHRDYHPANVLWECDRMSVAPAGYSTKASGSDQDNTMTGFGSSARADDKEDRRTKELCEENSITSAVDFAGEKSIKVSGVVDWVNACKGPAGFDIGHCRVDLAKLHGVAISDAFLASYLKIAGNDFTYHPYWDLLALIDVLFGPPDVYQGWIDLGVTGLTDALMIERVDAYMLSLLRRFETL